MSNPYDKAHELSRAILGSDEWKSFNQWKQAVLQDPEASEKMSEFVVLQQELQQKQFKGEAPTDEERERWSRAFDTVREYESVRQMMESEQRFHRLMADINRIITEPLQPSSSRA
jgi:cell fate (sporulation/competence/biofilm development) regulator YlbF (YheA/YmcA/DUF963 family)